VFSIFFVAEIVQDFAVAANAHPLMIRQIDASIQTRAIWKRTGKRHTGSDRLITP
jgi:hypothetical protein